MINRELTGTRQESADEYRGRLVYQQEDGYKFIRMTIKLHTPDEQSIVTVHTPDLTYREDTEHAFADPPLLAEDRYYFPVADDTEITLTIKGQDEEHRAYYTVHSTGIEEDSSFIWLDIVQSPKSISNHSFQPYHDLEVH